MPYSKQDIQTLYGLSPEELDQSLRAASLPLDRETYTDEEIQLSFDSLRSYFKEGLVSDYQEAAKLFEQQQSANSQLEAHAQTTTKKSGKGKKPSNSNENSVTEGKLLDISELLSQASEKCGTRIKLNVAADILAACGLPDTEEYTQDECDRFLEACDLLKNQGRSYEEIAAHFGTGDRSPHPLDSIVEAALIAESGLERLVEKITDRQTDNIPGLVNRSFLKHAAQKLAQSKENSELFFAELEERVMAQIEGKRQARSPLTTWDWEPNSLPLSSPTPRSLPEGSERGTSAE